MTDEWIKDKVIVVLGGTSRIGGGCAAERFGWRVRGAITMPPSAQAFDREAGAVVVLANVCQPTPPTPRTDLHSGSSYCQGYSSVSPNLEARRPR